MNRLKKRGYRYQIDRSYKTPVTAECRIHKKFRPTVIVIKHLQKAKKIIPKPEDRS
jgi:hypothetical protein